MVCANLSNDYEHISLLYMIIYDNVDENYSVTIKMTNGTAKGEIEFEALLCSISLTNLV